jgi:ATP-dependent RNA helicase DeaD
VHRIGRTGRAGRKGEAILFVMPRERHMLKIIERATRQTIAPMDLPSADSVLTQRLRKMKAKIVATLGDAKLTETLASLKTALGEYERELNVSGTDLAAALAHLVQGETRPSEPKAERAEPAEPQRREPRRHHEADEDAHQGVPRERPAKRDKGLETFRIEVGKTHGVKPGNIVGAIANEAELDSQHIGRVQIFDDHSLVDLPEGMPKEVFKHLQKVWVSGQQLKISRLRK